MEKFETFTVLIAKIGRSIRRLKTEEMAEFELKSPHVSCLYYLYLKGPLTAKELGEISAEDKAALSRSVEGLEEMGLIEPERGDKKRYKTPLKLTARGEEVAGRIALKADAIVKAAGKDMTEEERNIFYRCLTDICDNLQALCDGYDE
ncbi:MAG: winged helix-turn-helix transcriptional regulator [Clostridia bacterium]|nr:winged helix-turn-helix transcriptional regulator [Clostridia bacterium]